MTHDEQNPTAHDDSHTTTRPELGDALLGLERLGRLWAAHGIRIGVAALQTSAVTLSQVATTLSAVASTMHTGDPSTDDKAPQDGR